ncbi:hypothetical protein FGB62_169g222 [Gracilaria domingensis]|nr:hypothetical protein FGB62_169g222 [Gracilaria domingensis]
MAPSHPVPVTSDRSQPHVLTDEQRAIVTAVAQKGRNAIVNAVAGSGKTRTALATARQWLSTRPASAKPTQQVLLVAYNKRLAEDMSAQCEAMMPSAFRPFTHVRTIHSLGHHYFGGYGLTSDRELSNWTSDRKRPRISLPAFGLVIVDEAQDLTPVLFEFLRHFLSLLSCRPQLLVLGDPFQLLYRFKGADEAYILEADTNFKDLAANAPFEHFRLSICFRITHEMAAWINENLNPNNLHRARMPYPGWFEQHKNNIEQWWGEGIRANPKRPPSPGSVSYYRRPQTSQREALDRVVNKVETVFQNYGTDSSALLSPSISSNPYSPVRLITNKLYSVKGVEQSWFIDDSRRADGPLSDAVRRNKRIASTIHKFKGRESDAIVFLGFDSFAEHVEKVDPRNVFNMFYVGATRARKQLLIVQWSEQAYATHTSRVKYVEDEDFVPAPCPVTKALEYSPYIKMLCEESPACLEAKTTETIDAVLLGRQDYLVSGAHTPQRLSTMENVSAIIELGVEVQLQLLLDDGKLEVPPEWDGDEEMPLDLQVFFTHLRSQAEKARSYSWASVLEIATAFLTKRDRMYYRWRQVRYFERWPIVMNSVKLNEVVRNLVMLLDVVCGGKGAEAMKGADEVEATIVYAEVLTRLKGLRNDMRILFHDAFQFDMGCNPGFVQRCAPSLIGEPDIIVLSKEEAERLRKWRAKREKKDEDGKCDNDVDDGNGDGVTLVEVSVASKTSHDHLLQVGCYGAMQREMRIAKRAHRLKLSSKVVEVDIKMPKMFVAYANIGFLKDVKLHMNSFEFLHRVGCRKINVPFEALRIERPDRKENAEGHLQQGTDRSQDATHAHELSQRVMNLSQDMPDADKLSQQMVNPSQDIGAGPSQQPVNLSQPMPDTSSPSQQVINVSQEMPDAS